MFLTSSQLHERIEKVKIFAPAQLLRKRSSFVPITGLLVFFVMLGQLFLIDKSMNKNGITEFDSMELAHKAGTLNDPIEAILQVGRLLAKHQHENASFLKEMWPMLAIFALPVLLIVLGYSYVYLQPIYNFLWGDYVPFYERRKARARLILGGVVLTIIIGVVVNFISKHIGL